jgi:hypothetical protein
MSASSHILKLFTRENIAYIMTLRVLNRVPQELWDKIVHNLPALSASHAAHVFNFPLRLQQKRHAQVWNAIFEKDTWLSLAVNAGLNPVLIGHNIHAYYANRNPTGHIPAYMVLIINDGEGDMRFKKDILFQSLRPHTFNPDTWEVVFDSGITLNVFQAMTSWDSVTMDPRKLFSYKRKRLRSSYLYYQGSHSIGTISPRHIVGTGVGGGATKPKDVSMICGVLTLRPDSQREVQYILESPDLRAGDVELIGDNGESCLEIRQVLGWTTTEVSASVARMIRPRSRNSSSTSSCSSH